MLKYMLFLAIDLFLIVSFFSFIVLAVKRNDCLAILIDSIFFSVNIVLLGYHLYIIKGLL